MRKGNAYSKEDVVSGEHAKCGCPEDKFRQCACKFHGSPTVAGGMSHPDVTSFANYLAIKSKEAVSHRMGCNGGENRLKAEHPALAA